ncbi:MAG: hypothetical protein A2845_03275 [Candidatus Lloydbacteria bacterium RIFCSPHIGHO2_01_FULL_49_22]|uniref:PKD domain-containing protein n=1 Tax=Candidatus Lloydbacteria bacterium RIFCSPHIGHO2_01_FULL_49_22 TaxID=1798658 RepID=A0A1G2CWL3_9BACT|nr:MAG: hypothetical protein A2845_03275 [Candidatus Lloydbacteria bacterium RIFCSPHIGHO2_01_FULL_49_22]OGZ08952.1 MAG: hypothetical protein A3C14_03110 [Candidatus Lloydbacteria bacterium RIFCSPHIGHO2_02_FULL_50_18]
MIIGGVIVLWATCVCPAYASVVINEIAWMGTVVSANDEWIELHNDGTLPVDVSGWTLRADDGSPSITLSGTIAESGYFLLERTSDESVPTIPADQIYVGALGNESGETLRLRNENGDDVDVVVGGLNWENVGGDNVTKDTAQRIANGWATGAPTPRAENTATAGEVAGASTVISTDTAAETAVAPSGGSLSGGSVVKSPYPRNNIVVEAGEDLRAFTSFPVMFSGSSTGLYNEPLSRATYRWNFGDGMIGVGPTVAHEYEFPGVYVVTLEVFLAEYHSADRLAVSVTDPDVIISKVVSGEKGYVELTDRTDREMDLSGWSLSDGSATPFVFAPNSIILPKHTFLISHHTSGVAPAATSITLRDPRGASIFVWNALNSSVVAAPTSLPLVSKQSGIQRASSEKKLIEKVLPTPPSEEGVASALGTTTTGATILWEGQPAGTALSGSFVGNGMKWIFVLCTVLLIVIAGTIIARSGGEAVLPADEYIIIEGKDEFNN